jgi:hypothetical protein
MKMAGRKLRNNVNFKGDVKEKKRNKIRGAKQGQYVLRPSL